MLNKPFIKICGICRAEDALLAAQLGYSAIGLVFYAGSSRYVDVSAAQQLVAALELVPISKVGLFMNATSKEVAAICAAVALDMLQFHGDECASYCEQLHQDLQLPYIKAVPMGSLQSQAAVSEYCAPYKNACAFLLDANAKNQAGGSGELFDWRLIPQLNKPIIIAGGLNCDNARAAASCIANNLAAGLDVSSGTQSDATPRQKSASKMREFLAAVEQTLNPKTASY